MSPSSSTTLNNRVIIITGASSGIGELVAINAASRGASVVLAARRADALSSVAARCADPARALSVVTDVTKRSDVDALVRSAIERFGHVDVIVNNAGRGMTKLVSQLTDSDLDEMMLVNVKSALYGMQAVLPHFQERGAGHIINISSMLGRVPFAVIRSAYSASKHALNSLTANLRMELRDKWPGIHVTLVSPGVVATDFGNNATGGGPDSRSLPGAQDPDEVARLIVDTIEAPRADVYTRPMYQDMVVGYFSAPDMAEVEKKFGGAPPVTSPR